jgi:hypothetical protein
VWQALEIMKRHMRRLVTVWLLVIGVCGSLLLSAVPVGAFGGVPLRVHVQQSNQYLYTTLVIPVDVQTLQAGLPLASLSFDGYPVTIVSSVVDGLGVWQLVVSSDIELQAGNSVLRLYDGVNLSPVFDVSLPMYLVPRSPANLSPECDVMVASLTGVHEFCEAAYENPPVVEPPDEPEEPEEPEPVDPKPTEPAPVQPSPAPSLPSSTAPVADTPVVVTTEDVPRAPRPVPKPDSKQSVLSQSTGPISSIAQSAVPQEFEITPMTAVASVAAGIAVAGAGALVVNKLGINKPKL